MVKRFGLLLTVVGAVLLACAGVVLAQTSDKSQTAEKPSSPSSQGAGQGRAIPDRYIVVLEDRATEAAEQTLQATSRNVAQAAEQASAQVAGELAQKNGLEVTHTYGNALKGFAAKIPAGRLDAVRSDPRVDYVAEDREVKASAQVTTTGINRVDADLSSVQAGNGSGAANVGVAVIDTGIYRHPDLNVAGGYNCMSTTRSAWGDGNGHGTHVAGTAAAKDNTTGVVGTAPGARLWAMRVLNNSGSGSISTVVCGINRVTAMNKDPDTTNDIEVANMSLGGYVGPGADDGNCGNTNNDPEHKAICASVAEGITYVVAAGNDFEDVAESTPAAYDEVITVSALADYNGQPGGGAANTCNQDPARDDDFAFFSNYATLPEDQERMLGAPGVCIKSTWFVKKKVNGKIRTVPSYKTISGTSMASPHVAGAAAVYKANKNPSATPEEVRAFMLDPANSEAKNAGHTDEYDYNSEPVLQMDNY